MSEEEEITLDPDDVDISAEQIAEQLVKYLELPTASEEEAKQAIEFGAHALDIVLNLVDEESFEPLAIIAEIAQLYVVFHNLKEIK